jgi:hypothetical protein
MNNNHNGAKGEEGKKNFFSSAISASLRENSFFIFLGGTI